VSEILEEIRVTVTDQMRQRLLERRAQGRHDLPDEEIEMEARIAGTMAKSAAANGVAQAFQLGVNRTVTERDYEEITSKVITKKE